MFFPARMKKVSIIVHEKYSDELISALHEASIMEITDTLKTENISEELIEPATVSKLSADCASSALRINRILDVLEQVAPEPQGLVKTFTEPQPPLTVTVEARKTAEILNDANIALKSIESKILAIETELNEIKERLAILKHQESQIEALKPLRFDLKHLGISEHLVIKAGTVEDVGILRHALKDLKEIVIKSAQVNGVFSVIIISHIDRKEELEAKLRGRFFSEFEISNMKGEPTQVLGRISNEQSKIKSREKVLLDNLSTIRNKWFKRLLILEEELTIEKSRKDIRNKFGKTNKTNVIMGWVAARQEQRLKDLCNKVTRGNVACHFDHPKTNPEPEQVPIRLHNPKWAKPFEHLVKIYSPPRYNEIDPSMLIAIPFVLFFGLMLGDAGYGLVILLFCIYGFFYVGKVRPYVKIASYIGICLGLSTVIFGFLMGTFFGDLIPRLIYNDANVPLYRATVLGFHLPYDPIRNPLLLLLISLIIGILYLVTSLIVAAGQNIRNKNYKSLLFDQITWFILVPSGLILICYAFFNFVFSDHIMYLAYIGIIIGLGLLVKNKLALSFFEITGWLGDVLSFARLLALGMATAGIAMTINVIAELMPSWLTGITGLIFGIILIKFWRQMELKFMLYIGYLLLILSIIGFIGIAINDPSLEIMITIGIGAGLGAFLAFTHLINLVLQALGAGVHSLRLQYVEFFSRCYEGGGDFFRPFSSARQYTKLKSRR